MRVGAFVCLMCFAFHSIVLLTVNIIFIGARFWHLMCRCVFLVHERQWTTHGSVLFSQETCATMPVFFCLSTSLFIPRFPIIRLPLLPPHSVQVCPKSLFDRKRGRRGDVEWDKGGREIDRGKIEGWGFERTWNEPINPERLLSRVKCLSQADA